jgi:hypothetical protein
VFNTRRTEVAALLPATQAGGIDAVLDTRGPLVPGAPMHPKENPEDGSLYGGDTYGWRAEHVELDKRGKPGTRTELSTGPKRTVSDATIVDGTLTTLGTDPATWNRSIVTFVRSDREKLLLDLPTTGQFAVANGRTWLVITDVSQARQRENVQAWSAHEIGGARRTLELTGAPAKTRIYWTSIAMHDDRVVAIGTTQDPSTGIPISFTAFARLSPSAASLDITTLAPLNRLVILPECRGVARAKLTDKVTLIQQADAELAACGVPAGARADVSIFPEGGVGRFSIKDANADVTACARLIVEPLLVCPLDSSGTVSLSLRR